MSMHCGQNCIKLLQCSNKAKNDVTYRFPADPKLSENVCN